MDMHRVNQGWADDLIRDSSRYRMLPYHGSASQIVDLKNPDFAAMARAMGIHAVRVEDPGELSNAIRDVLAHDGPAVLDVVTATQELSMPPTITAEQIKGFSLWVLRAVMSGRGDEVIDVAKTNLLPR